MRKTSPAKTVSCGNFNAAFMYSGSFAINRLDSSLEEGSKGPTKRLSNENMTI